MLASRRPRVTRARSRFRRRLTWKPIHCRLRDAGIYSRVTDPRKRVHVHPVVSLVNAISLGMLAGSKTLRAVEQFTDEMHPSFRAACAIPHRINDTDIGRFVNALTHAPMRAALHEMVKAELRRKTLEPIGLPHRWLAIDGKGLGKLTGEDNLAHPDIQPVDSESTGRYGLARVHRVVLISSEACVAIDQRPIPGHTNEIGALPALLAELFEVYAKTGLLQGIIADAGNCSESSARQIHDAHCAYALRIKQGHGELWLEAQRLLAWQGAARAESRFTEMVSSPDGPRLRLEYRLYRAHLGEAGWLAWTHARQLIRIERRLYDADGALTEHGNRYWVSNEPWATMTPSQWLELARRYWRIENESNWTADTFFKEDARRPPWTKQAEPLYAVAALRLIIMSILALLRCGIRVGGGGERLGWEGLILQVRCLLCAGEVPREVAALV